MSNENEYHVIGEPEQTKEMEEFTKHVEPIIKNLITECKIHDISFVMNLTIGTENSEIVQQHAVISGTKGGMLHPVNALLVEVLKQCGASLK